MVRTSLRTVTMQIPSQKIITKYNVSIDIAGGAYYHVTDPEKAVIAIENVYNAISQISQTRCETWSDASAWMNCCQPAGINEQIKNVIDLHTEPWGAQVTAVEIKDIELPDNMQRAMAREAEASVSAAPRSWLPKVNTRRPSSSARPRISSRSIRSRCSFVPCRPWRNLGREEFHDHLPPSS